MVMRWLTLIIVICALADDLYSQDNKIFRGLFKEAESILLYMNEEEDALERYLELEKMDPDNAHIQYKIGVCYLHIPGKKDLASQKGFPASGRYL